MEASEVIRNFVKDELKEIRIIRSMIENFMGYEELTEKELKEIKKVQKEIEEGKGILYNPSL